MKKPPKPRTSVHKLYWYFLAERHKAFERRIEGGPSPWTPDRILQQYKFCNSFRAADRVSQYLIRDVAYDSASATAADTLFRIVAFRTFSNIQTWRGVHSFLQRQPTLDDLGDGRFEAALDDVWRRRGRLYTGAFILCATNAYGHARKHLNHVALFKHMFIKDRLDQRLLSSKSLEELYQLLHGYPLMGDFMSYQTAIDLNYSDLLSYSENDFTQPGPGALRGLRKVFVDLGDFTPAEAIHWMVDQQEVEFARYGLSFGGLWGRPLHAIDCQGAFCEIDKYCREAIPELRSARVRIKTRFAPSDESFKLFFPPKWQLNDKVPKRPVLGAQPPTRLEGNVNLEARDLINCN